jgi:hypothetical protein
VMSLASRSIKLFPASSTATISLRKRFSVYWKCCMRENGRRGQEPKEYMRRAKFCFQLLTLALARLYADLLASTLSDVSTATLTLSVHHADGKLKIYWLLASATWEQSACS